MPVRITIDMSDDGSVALNGPIDQLVLMHGILDVVKGILYQKQAEAASRLVQPASGLMLPKQ